MFYGFYSTPPPPSRHHGSLHDAFVSSFSSFKLLQPEIIYFAMSYFQRLSSPPSEVLLRILCKGRMHVYLFEGLNPFFWRYSHHLILLFAHFVLSIRGHLLFFSFFFN